MHYNYRTGVDYGYKQKFILFGIALLGALLVTLSLVNKANLPDTVTNPITSNNEKSQTENKDQNKSNQNQSTQQQTQQGGSTSTPQQSTTQGGEQTAPNQFSGGSKVSPPVVGGRGAGGEEPSTGTETAQESTDNCGNAAKC